MQVKLELAPEVAKYVPAPQAVQVKLELAPGVAEYVPAPQAVQVKLEFAARVAEYVPAPQEVQLDARPFPILYVPAGHAAHVALVNAPAAAE